MTARNSGSPPVTEPLVERLTETPISPPSEHVDVAWDPQTPLERCCHIIKSAGTSSNASPSVALCGFHPNDRVHAMGSHAALLCPACERPRCPECVQRYSRGER